ncbi:hypothetical protein WLF14_06240 [Pseudomonas fluorescens]|jgi:hypothetical protein|uniref:hypothetical protein n=1 Tax=Pseudomonas fluorescens TaxID=294 RepID=UPI00313B1AE0
MATHKSYTVLIPFPKGGGHWSVVGEKLELLDVQASALRTAGRLALTSDLNPAQVAEKTTKAKATSAEAK